MRKLQIIDSETVIGHLKEIFAIHDIPDVIRSDRDLQFTSLAFKNFATKNNISLTYSDPYFSQGNGCAERAVRLAKRLFKQADPLAALMAYRTTPLESTGYSPSQLLMGRDIKTMLPMLQHKLILKYTPSCDVKDNDSKAKAKSAESYNMRKGAKILPELKDNQAVRIQLPAEKQWGVAEKIIARRGETSYFIRNRRHLQAIPEPIVTDG